MGEHVRVGVARETSLAGHGDTAENKRTSFCERVNVEAMSNTSHVRPPPGHAPGYLSVQWSFAE